VARGCYYSRSMNPYALSLVRHEGLARSACFSALVAVMFVVSPGALAQGPCGPGWQQVVSAGGGLNSIVLSSVRFDPDGSGPRSPVLAVGGGFTTAGSAAANFIATWDPATNVWAPLGSGIGGTVESLAVMPNGDLVAGGNFTTAGGAAANYVARWSISSQTWSAMSTGMNDVVLALAVQPNGDLIAGGTFSRASGVPAFYVARWNQAAAGGAGAWEPIGSGMDSNVNALVVLPSGDLIAGGNFSTAGGNVVRRIAQLGQGSNIWLPVSTGFSGNVYALTVMPNGDLIAGGLFVTAGPNTVNYVARYSPGAAFWTALGGGVDNTVWSLAALPGGDIAVGGSFTNAGGTPAHGIARWSDSSGAWSAIGSTNNTNGKISTILTTPNGELYAGGYFTLIGGNTAPYFARFSTGGTAPLITAQPSPQAACLNDTAAFSIIASGTGPFAYQWHKDTVAIDSVANPSAATDSLTLMNVNPGDAATYDCIVTNACGSVTSNTATLTICIGDFNCDGGVDGSDIEAFFAEWSAGNVTSDVNFDGGVDGADVEVFFERWVSGC
jgi:hypothetical protein